jgi:polygalacturonase
MRTTMSDPSRRKLLGLIPTAAAIPLLGKTQGSGYRIHNISEYGARGDGQTLDTAAVQRAIDAAHGDRGGVVLVPAGDFLVGTLELKSNVTLHLSASGRLLGSGKPADYAAGKGVPPGNGNVVLLSPSRVRGRSTVRASCSIRARETTPARAATRPRATGSGRTWGSSIAAAMCWCFSAGARIENVSFSNLVMRNVTGPISIGLDSNYRRAANAPARAKGVVRNLTFQGIRATVVSEGGQYADMPIRNNFRPGGDAKLHHAQRGGR